MILDEGVYIVFNIIDFINYYIELYKMDCF